MAEHWAYLSPDRDEMALRFAIKLGAQFIQPEDPERMKEHMAYAVRMADALMAELKRTLPPRPPMPPVEKAYLVGDGPKQPVERFEIQPGKPPRKKGWWER